MRVLDSGQMSPGKCHLINRLTLLGATSYLHNPVMKNTLCTHTWALKGRPLEIPPANVIFPLSRLSADTQLCGNFSHQGEKGTLLPVGAQTAGLMEWARLDLLTNYTACSSSTPNEMIPKSSVRFWRVELIFKVLPEMPMGTCMADGETENNILIISALR